MDWQEEFLSNFRTIADDLMEQSINGDQDATQELRDLRDDLNMFLEEADTDFMGVRESGGQLTPEEAKELVDRAVARAERARERAKLAEEEAAKILKENEGASKFD